MKKPKVAKSWSKHNLPSDLWPEILSRLPVKSLLRFRRVAKSWRSLIDDPNFCRVHLNSFNNNLDETHLFAVQNRVIKKDISCAKRDSNTFWTHGRSFLNTKWLGNNWNVVSSMDGLFMLQYDKPTLELMLWNPSIRKNRALPHIPVVISGAMEIVDLGFGFDPLIQDYKHVRLVMEDRTNLHSIAIYTVGTGSWKTIEFQGKGIPNWRWTFGYKSRANAVCFRGGLYFIATKANSNDGELVSFDLSDEVFAFIRLPQADSIIPTKIRFKAVTLVDGGCSFGLVYLMRDKEILWVLESSGVDNDNSMNWTRHDVSGPSTYHQFRLKASFMCLKKNRDLLLTFVGQGVYSYNFDTREEKRLMVNKHWFRFTTVCAYIESLVLMKG